LCEGRREDDGAAEGVADEGYAVEASAIEEGQEVVAEKFEGIGALGLGAPAEADEVETHEAVASGEAPRDVLKMCGVAAHAVDKDDGMSLAVVEKDRPVGVVGAIFREGKGVGSPHPEEPLGSVEELDV